MCRDPSLVLSCSHTEQFTGRQKRTHSYKTRPNKEKLKIHTAVVFIPAAGNMRTYINIYIIYLYKFIFIIITTIKTTYNSILVVQF